MADIRELRTYDGQILSIDFKHGIIQIGDEGVISFATEEREIVECESDFTGFYGNKFEFTMHDEVNKLYRSGKIYDISGDYCYYMSDNLIFNRSLQKIDGVLANFGNDDGDIINISNLCKFKDNMYCFSAFETYVVFGNCELSNDDFLIVDGQKFAAMCIEEGSNDCDLIGPGGITKTIYELTDNMNYKVNSELFSIKKECDCCDYLSYVPEIDIVVSYCIQARRYSLVELFTR